MGKEITAEEILELIAEGASLSVEKDKEIAPGPIEVSDMGNLVTYVKKIAHDNVVLAEEKINHIETLLEKLIEATSKNKLDMTPISLVLKELIASTRQEKQPYIFHIERDGRGLLKTVEAVPKEQIVN